MADTMTTQDPLAILDVIDGIVDDTHPEGDGCLLCVALEELRFALTSTEYLDVDRGAASVADDLRREHQADLPTRVVIGANGAYWRDYGDSYSMALVSEDNDPVEVVAVYVREAAYVGGHPEIAIHDYVDAGDGTCAACVHSDEQREYVPVNAFQSTCRACGSVRLHPSVGGVGS